MGCDEKPVLEEPKEEISTHTSRVGCDKCRLDAYPESCTFLLTHPVWDVTICSVGYTGNSKAFLLTHPVWDVTYRFLEFALRLVISTHTSRVGCDNTGPQGPQGEKDFYSHIPCGM